MPRKTVKSQPFRGEEINFYASFRPFIRLRWDSEYNAIENCLVSIMEMHFHVHKRNLWHFEKKTSFWRSRRTRYGQRYLRSFGFHFKVGRKQAHNQAFRPSCNHTLHQVWTQPQQQTLLKSLRQIRLSAHKHRFKRPRFLSNFLNGAKKNALIWHDT